MHFILKVQNESFNQLKVSQGGRVILCWSGQEMAPTGQRPLLKDSWHQNSLLWEEQLADLTVANKPLKMTVFNQKMTVLTKK